VCSLLFVICYSSTIRTFKMPQLKKLSVLPNGILPKVEGLDSVFLTYSAQHDASSYLSLLTDMKSHLLSSEADSDGGDSLPSTKPRKRQRLDHLSQEEKIMRRKMKNRVAAQTARDRKKARMQELEEQVIELETDKKMLMISNMELQAKISILQNENEALKLRLGEECLNKSVKEESLSTSDESDTSDSFAESRLSKVSSSLDHASFINVPLQKEQDLQTLTLLMMQYVYLPVITRLMICLIYFNNVAKICYNVETSAALCQNLVKPQIMKHQHLKWWGPHQNAWNPTKN